MAVYNGKIRLDAVVTVSYYVKDGKLTLSHVDIESGQLTDIIKSDDLGTYCKGKPGGVFIALRKEMRARQPSFVVREAKRLGKMS